MNKIDQIKFWAVQGLGKFIYGLFTISLGLGFFYWLYFLIDEEKGNTPMQEMLDINNWIGIVIFNSMCFGCIWYRKSIMTDSFKTIKSIKLLESIFDEQGGFLWSNQQY